ncbi:MAG: CRTAC1 family protein [Anaerolineales bacterium]|nr:CRTAC1 family protein [Anaerolineales bacterium]
MKRTTSLRKALFLVASLGSSLFLVALCLSSLARLAGVTASAAGGAPFQEVGPNAGVSMTHQLPTQPGDYFIIGQAWGDYDGDGWLDLYLTNGAGPNKLFHNSGDGTFVEVLDFPMLALTTTLNSGANFVDFDNDGWLDLYVLGLGANHLFQNIAGQGWLDVSLSSGLADEGQGETSAWADFNADGWLDVYVVNWACESCPEGYRDGLYFNNGDGTFNDISAQLNISGTLGPGFTASSVDFDNDGDLDIYVVNDKHYGNVLWRNDGPGCGGHCFVNVAGPAGAATEVFGMGFAVGDYDHDLDLDFFFTDIGPSTLLQNQTSQGTPDFLDVSAAAGVNFDAIGWGSVFFDYNNDGWLDIYQAVMNPNITQTNRLFQNAMNGAFMDVSETSGANNNGPTLGVAYADYDRDGHLDLVIGNLDEAYHLYHNEGTVGNWLSVNLIGGGDVNYQAIGSRVYLTATNGMVMMQEVANGSSLGAGNSLALHFGLGAAEVADLRIDWPDGSSTLLSGNQLPLNSTWYHQYEQPGCTAAMTVSADVQLEVPLAGPQVYTHTIRNDGNCPDGFFLNWASSSTLAYAQPAFLWLDPGETGEIALTVLVSGFAGDLTELTVGSVLDADLIVTRTDETIVSGSLHYLPIIKKAD